MSGLRERRPAVETGRPSKSSARTTHTQTTTAACEVCDRRPEPCECIECDYPDPWEIPEGELCACRCDHGTGEKCRCLKCSHLGPLRTFRGDVAAHLDCAPAGWSPR